MALVKAFSCGETGRGYARVEIAERASAVRDRGPEQSVENCWKGIEEDDK